MKEALAIAATLFLAAPAPAWITITNSPGGSIDDFTTRRYELEKAGIGVKIAGGCVSACTIFTGMANVCVEPGAFFKFHGGWSRPPHRADWATNVMLDRMAPKFRQAIEDSGEPLPSFESGEFLVIDDAVEQGMMEAC